MIEKNFKENYFLMIACLVAIVVMLPIAFFGIPSGNDMPQHFRFAQTFYDSLTTGDGFPSWADKENFGYGDIGIRFYPPLAYYFLAFTRILVGNWYDATWLTFMFWMVLGCYGIYLWAHCWLSVKESAFSAMFFAIFPYHLSQIYINFNYSEFVGAAVLPFCFAFLTRIFQRRKWTDVLGLAVAYSALILSHLPLLVIGSLCLLLYALMFLRKENFIQPLIKSAISVGISLAASAFYWIKMIGEMKWVSVSSEKYSTGYYGYENHFFPFYFHSFNMDFKLGYFLITDLPVILDFLFLVSIIIYFVYRKSKNLQGTQAEGIVRKVLPLGLFAFFMLTPLSRPIWQILTPLQKVQLPSRWLAIVAICGAVVAGATIHYLIESGSLKKRGWVYGYGAILFVILMFNFIYNLHPVAFVPIERGEFESQMQKLYDEKSFDCWWTVWSNADALKIKEKISIEAREAKVITWEAEKRIFEVSAGNEGKVRIATFYYPLWQATVNGTQVGIEKDENGAMLIAVGSEKSTIELYFQEPLSVRVASILSLLTWLFLGGAAVFLLGKKLFSSKQLV